MPFLQSIEMNCQLLDIIKLMLDEFQILQVLYLFSPFLPVVLFYNIHFPIWSSFDVLN